jgi:Family of unknown function (DUF5694)
MRAFLSALALVSFQAISLGQTSFPPKINVILLGSFHYGATSDRNSTKFPDLFSAKRQGELDSMVQKLAATGITQIFVEGEARDQVAMDKLFAKYLSGTAIDTVTARDETVQIGFRAAKRLGLPNVRCVDVKQELPYEAMEKYEQESAKDTTVKSPPFFDTPWPFTDSTRTLRLSRTPLSTYYIGLNDAYHRQANLYDYLHYAMSYGRGKDYTGADFTTSWYNRNLKIYTNILRELQPTDTTVLVLFGAGHTNMLRQFFTDHPSFRIVEVADVLR